MANENKLKSLMDEAVRAYTGMITVYPQFNHEEEALNVSELAPKFNGCFAVNNSTVCFVSEDNVYVIPLTRDVLKTLRESGFYQEFFYVPFSNWNYPKLEENKWRGLLRKASQEEEQEFLSDCVNYCDQNHIGTISEESLKKCFQIPDTGVDVEHHYFKDTYFPVLRSKCFDSISAERIGKFCTNNGRVVFTYRDGETYVAKGYKILTELRAAGYTEEGIFVPFSNGERIVDSFLKEKWEALPKF